MKPSAGLKEQFFQPLTQRLFLRVSLFFVPLLNMFLSLALLLRLLATDPELCHGRLE
jgi:hypothetical protein